MDLRLWVLATPVDGTLIDLSLVSQVKEIRKPKRLIAGLGILPVKMRAPIYELLHVGAAAPRRPTRRGHLGE